MTGFLSIVWRELAVGARQTTTHRARLLAGSIVVAFFGLLLIFQSGPPQIFGPMIFHISALLLFLQALSSGLRYTADALSEEKREGTLGLLFLTELRSGEVVLGKMCARALRGFYALIATLPIFTLCILFGGVRGLDAFNIALLLVTTMLFSLSAAILVSSRTTEDKAAFLGSIAFVTALCVIPPILWRILSIPIPATAWSDFLLFLSPLYAYSALPGAGGASPNFLKSILCLNFLSVLFVVLASKSLSHSFKNQFATPLKSPAENPDEIQPADRWVQVRQTRSNALLEQQPFLWLLKRDRLYPRIVLIFAVIGLAGSMIAYDLLRRFGPGIYFGIIINSFYAVHLVWKLFVASDALRRLHHDRRSGALEQLLVTPLPVETFAKTQVNRTFRLFLPSAIALAIGNLIILSSSIISGLTAVGIGGAIFLFIDARTLAWRAVLQALKPARYPVAILRVAGVTLLPPTLILMLILYSGGIGRTVTDINTIFSVWFIGCGIYDAILIRHAKRKLNNEFRLLASDTPNPAKPKTSALPKFLQWLLLIEPKPALSRP